MQKHSQILLVLFFAFTMGSVHAQDVFTNGGARYRGLNGGGITLGDHWSTMQNQAGMVDVENFSAGLFAFNRFGLSELNTIGACAVLPRENQAFGISMESYGFESYRKSNVGFSYAMSLSESFDVGVQIAYHQVQLGGVYGSTSTLTPTIGMRYTLRDDLVIAAHAYNFTRSKLADFNDERVPTLLRTGVQWELSEQFSGMLEVQKSIDDPVGIIGAIEYKPLDILYFRAGAGTSPDRFSFGLGLAFDQFAIDMASAYHQQLGLIPHLSLTYRQP